MEKDKVYLCPIDGVQLSEDFESYMYLCGQCGRSWSREELRDSDGS